METLPGFVSKGLFSKINQLSNATGILSRLAAFLSARTTSSGQFVLLKAPSQDKSQGIFGLILGKLIPITAGEP
jgi:hypothetical protein